MLSFKSLIVYVTLSTRDPRVLKDALSVQTFLRFQLVPSFRSLGIVLARLPKAFNLDDSVCPFKARLCFPRAYHGPGVHPIVIGAPSPWVLEDVDYNPHFFMFSDHYFSISLFDSYLPN